MGSNPTLSAIRPALAINRLAMIVSCNTFKDLSATDLSAVQSFHVDKIIVRTSCAVRFGGAGFLVVALVFSQCLRQVRVIRKL